MRPRSPIRYRAAGATSECTLKCRSGLQSSLVSHQYSVGYVHSGGTRWPYPVSVLRQVRAHAQGNLRASSTVTGIMLAFRWYITHSEPDSVMTTSVSVKISDIIDQPLSTFEFMCRK